MAVSRFGVSLEVELLEALDEYVGENNFPNRSQAIRQLVERNLVEKKWQCNRLVAGTITLVYNCRKSALVLQILENQCHYHQEILSIQHYLLSSNLCMEVVAVKGEARRLTKLADKLIALKGIRHGKLTMTQCEDLED